MKNGEALKKWFISCVVLISPIVLVVGCIVLYNPKPEAINLEEFVNRFNKYYQVNMKNDDSEIYDRMKDVLHLEKIRFSQEENGDYFFTYSPGNGDYFTIVLRLDNKQDIELIGIITNPSIYTRGYDGANEILKLVSYGCIYAINNNMSKDKIDKIFTETCEMKGNINEYNGIGYLLEEGDVALYLDIYYDLKKYKDRQESDIQIDDKEDTTKEEIDYSFVTSEEKRECINVINTTPYRSDVYCKSWGSIIDAAFVELEIGIERLDENNFRVTFSGVAMMNPSIKSTYNEYVNAGIDTSMLYSSGLIKDSEIVLDVDLSSGSCEKVSVRGLSNDILLAYAMGSF
ncbi:MAG: hypothetical protein E7252_07165 [Lachnospira sp.]|nr:hypothetical protein [Lachnospira sp.]